MAKFNQAGKTRAAVTSPIVTEAVPTGRTYNATPGYARDAKSELFLLAVTNMVGEHTFYESAATRDVRFNYLVKTVAVDDPAWLAAFLPWLRNEGFMRDAPMVAAMRAAHAMLAAEIPGSRKVIDSVLQRADEPGKALAYWTQTFGRKLPMPVKRGVGDAALRLYREYPLMKYDTPSHAFRFADVLALTHAGDRKGSAQRIRGGWQHALFEFAIDRRYGRAEVDDRLPLVAAHARLRAEAGDDPSALLDPARLRAAGMTWEDALSLAGDRVPKAALWESLVPVMGLGAIVRNLRNLDEAEVGRETRQHVIDRLSDPEQVRRSKLFPITFLAAARAVASLHYAQALDEAMTASVANVPTMTGRTLIVVDMSGSMFGVPLSAKSTLDRADAAKVFAAALAVGNPGSTLVAYSNSSAEVPVRKASSLSRVIESIPNYRGGTYTAQAISRHYAGHDRVVLITDEQHHGSAPSGVVPARVPLYTFNLAGYRYGSGPSGSGTRHTFGGLTDATFKLIPLLEAGRDAAWPFEVERVAAPVPPVRTMVRREGR